MTRTRMKPKLCSIPGCETIKYGQLEGQAAIYLYTLDTQGELEQYPVCAPHYMMALTMQGVYESPEQANQARKEKV